MTDSLKLAEMQRTSIEFERQRHLANWFIKSSPHMANPQSINSNGGGNIPNASNCGSNNNNKAQKLSSGTKNGTITTTNPLFLLISSGQKPPPPPPPHPHPALSGNLALSRSQVFTSQTNLPLQIVTSSAQEGHKPKLRRFNSHDTSANMFSVAEFENARLARRNEIELKQRQQQRFKINSLSSGGDCSTGDSKGSKYSNDSQTEPLLADVFLERYPLPRIVKVSTKLKFNHETLQSSSSNGSSSSNSSSWLVNKSHCDSSKQNGELFLLYRHVRQRKIYHGYNTKSGVGHRKKGVMIPQEFPGYFSLISEKGTSTATMYTTLIQLIRERVHKFISVDNLPAFAEQQSITDTFQTRNHYIKSTARGGQVFRLLAVFEDGKQQDNGSLTNKTSNSGREKEKGRYAQLLNENRQILYVSLTTKGKFYEIEPSIPQILQKTGMTNDTKKKLNPDCVHRISNIITSEIEFPINIKFISGPPGTSNTIPDHLTITKMSIENILVACPIDDIEVQSPLHLKKLQITPQMILTKCFLGFENEQRMLTNQNVQNILKFCQFNCDHFLKMVELETFNKVTSEQGTSSLTSSSTNNKGRVESLKILKPLNFPKLLRREKSIIAHEKEDSIIFLSKNDLANLESKDDNINMAANNNANNNHNRISDKMKVFQSTKKKWFRKNDKHNSLTNLDIDAQAKRMSMERYNDMSKLLQERFGDTLMDAENGLTTNDSIVCAKNKRSIVKPQIQKSFSLQEVDFLDKPDLVPANFSGRNVNESENNIHRLKEEEDERDECTASSTTAAGQQQHSFISEKMYTEFHVKTKQYSKSSSSLHQLLQFAVPQRTNITSTTIATATAVPAAAGETKKLSFKAANRKDKKIKPFTKNLEFSFSDIPYEEHNSIIHSATTGLIPHQISSVIDDLPYSSVRDSLLTSDSIHEINNSNDDTHKIDNHLLITTAAADDDIKENIYAEICHDNDNIVENNCLDIKKKNNRKENYNDEEKNDGATVGINYPLLTTGGGAAAISRVQINVITNSTTKTTTLFQEQSSQSQGASYDNIYNTLK